MLSGPDAPLNGVVQKIALTSPSMSIMTGTDEIHKNIIGERILGLPAEPTPTPQ
jgi:alkylation response protein AidB-like acyl-CoA dehydrogenase